MANENVPFWTLADSEQVQAFDAALQNGHPETLAEDARRVSVSDTFAKRYAAAAVLASVDRETASERAEDLWRTHRTADCLQLWGYTLGPLAMTNPRYLQELWEHTQEPSNGVAYLNALRSTHDIRGVRRVAGELLAIDGLPTSTIASVLTLLATAEKDAGRLPVAIDLFEQCLRVEPTPNTMSNIMMTTNYSVSHTYQDYLHLAARYNELFATLAPRYVHGPIPEKDVLRIGFVSGDFYSHSLSILMGPVFTAMRHFSHELYAYYTREASNGATANYRSSFHKWRDVPGLSSDELAARIFSDEIDVLVDLGGHTALSGTAAFIHQPAPVQVGWLSGMMCPTGLDTVPYFIATDGCVPAAASAGPETILRVPAAHSYDPTYVTVERSSTTPAERNGYVTFGSFNNPCKLHEATFGAWAAILTQTDKSRLRVKVYTQEQAQKIERYFESKDLSGRVACIFQLPSPSSVHAAYVDDIDIVLDTWPCGGCLTTAEALWCGCPVVTLRGDTFSHLQSWQVLKQVGGLERLACDDVNVYIERAVELAGDVGALSQLRRTIMESFATCPLLDAYTIASNILSALARAYRLQRGCLSNVA